MGRKERKHILQRAMLCGVLPLCLLWGGLQLWMLQTEQHLRWQPNYTPVALAAIGQKPKLQKQDYQTLLMQTGLGKSAVDALYQEGSMGQLSALQQAFFAMPQILCKKNTPISAEEQVVDEKGKRSLGTRLVGLQAGDILLTPSCHTFGWRNGHAALVLDAEKGIALESVVLGQPSCLQSIEKWESYPAVLVLRLKGASKTLRAQIAKEAEKDLNGIPYGLTVGLFSEKFTQDALTATHCAHLVWAAFQKFGYDLDSTGQAIVTPKDLANSPLLELHQAYGVNPKALWE